MNYLKTGALALYCTLCCWNNLFAQSATPNVRSILNQLTLPSTARSMRASSTDPNFDGNGDSKLIEPGETLVMADLDGPGIIRHIWNTSASLNPYSVRALVIRIYWDNAEKPSVEVPLGDFFGIGQGTSKDYQSFPVNVSSYGRSRNCFWSMPFKKHAKITVSNELSGYGPAYFYYYVDWEKVKALPNEVLYFHARYHQQSPAKPGDHLVLNTTGKGNYVGTVYSLTQAVNGWFGEGDDRFFIDGEKVPSIQGTGTEDYFGDAWEFHEFSGAFNGVPMYEGSLAGDRVSAFRWHIMDPIHFDKSLKMTIEHKGSEVDNSGLKLSGSNERADWISSVAFWYQTPVAFSNDLLPPAIERVPPYQIFLATSLKFRASPNKIAKEKTGIHFVPEVPDGEIAFEFEVKEAGRYKMMAVLVDGLFGSKYQPFVDDQPAGQVLDLLSKGGDWREFVFGYFNFEKGIHTFRLKGEGASAGRKNSLPEKFEIGVSSISLLRVESLR